MIMMNQITSSSNNNNNTNGPQPRASDVSPLQVELVQLLHNYGSQYLQSCANLRQSAHLGGADLSETFTDEVKDLVLSAERLANMAQLVLATHTRTCAQPTEEMMCGDGGVAGVVAAAACLRTSRDVLHGVLPSLSATTTSSTQQTELLLHGCRPVGLSNATLALISANTSVLSRRSASATTTTNAAAPVKIHDVGVGAKRKRDDDDEMMEAPLPPLRVQLLRDEGIDRVALYTARAGHLPHVERCVRGFVSPAVRRYAVANARAEALMLERSWRVGTKAQLLREVPRLRQTITDSYVDELNALRVRGGEAASASELHVIPRYLHFCHINTGVVRVFAQGCASMDITFDVVEERWRVLRLTWMMKVPLQQHSQVASRAWATTATAEDEDDEDEEVRPMAVIAPTHHDVMETRFLQQNFSEGGLEEGCLAFNRLVCVVAMDVVVQQLHTCAEMYSAGPLRQVMSVDVRQGTYAVCRVQLPGESSTSQQQQREAVRIIFKLQGGTLTCERGDDAHATTSTGGSGISLRLPLLETQITHHCSPAEAVVLDVEELLWQEMLK